jgi:hypothetical protein
MKRFRDYITESSFTDEEHKHIDNYVKHKIAAQSMHDRLATDTPGGKGFVSANEHDKAAMDAISKVHPKRMAAALTLGNKRVQNRMSD